MSDLCRRRWWWCLWWWWCFLGRRGIWTPILTWRWSRGRKQNKQDWFWCKSTSVNKRKSRRYKVCCTSRAPVSGQNSSFECMRTLIIEFSKVTLCNWCSFIQGPRNFIIALEKITKVIMFHPNSLITNFLFGYSPVVWSPCFALTLFCVDLDCVRVLFLSSAPVDWN